MERIDELMSGDDQQIRAWRRNWECQKQPTVDLLESFDLRCRSRRWGAGANWTGVALFAVLMLSVITVPVLLGPDHDMMLWFQCGVVALLGTAACIMIFGTIHSVNIRNAGADVVEEFFNDLARFARELYPDHHDDAAAVRALVELSPREAETLYEDRLTYLIARQLLISVFQCYRQGPAVADPHAAQNLVELGRRFGIEWRWHPKRSVTDRVFEYLDLEALHALASRGGYQLCRVYDRTAGGVRAPAA